ncbi:MULTISPECIES: nucleotide sugar dehydrogenase [unclassified Rhizobium]|uniref:nucleotide sugar dehydrogenase n=1 Tax=unclassified Rhizobium TaxID=2613769 RepID=UPI00115EF4E7|nr:MULTISPECIES: nucleotide sugar dehydrogenase [unclassified Rhizobium]MBZ5759773.1 nucleotide sugar dehydrogenase [Rhizobium sp. VS19-DR96]MBZ5766161.1 nucleotide sugar dehydrogenase [Rhizobium sp. VS19-DR129.2]MBZ5772944.1 nucleotide sugar dehydrogenase [Rhizobium sp. VS19-DRK62.2]MBZ5783928.1 nucleotide sugar dehydrogenase [Rhizobium sp. VS19-DR121]MBZ5803505.1 nucleotide sugar dehydrogenase [Rhizobium sp. VS19-DR181]
MSEKIAVIGLGYVGLPVAMALADKYADVIGFDVNHARIEDLKNGRDSTREVSPDRLRETSLRLSSSLEDLGDRTVFIVAVPTPIDKNRQPDLRPLIAASRTVGQVLKPGAIVVYESTVFPGVTEEICGPVLAEVSGLKQGEGFHLGYSPERINPGDREHTFERIVKVVSGDTAETLERVAAIYSSVVDAGIHRATSIRVAEAAKVIENTQRDLNIALMNELSIIFEKMDIRTADVLEAARTKWNFLPFTPGLVGGHCIGVDPYYLTAKAEELGYHPEVILSGRRINDGMGAFIAQKLIKMLVSAEKPINGARIGIFGLTFKENVPDLRNSRVPDIIRELHQFGLKPLIHDPMADADEAEHEYDVRFTALEAFPPLDAVVLAVPHRQYLADDAGALLGLLKPGGVVVDVKSALQLDNPGLVGHAVWSL